MLMLFSKYGFDGVSPAVFAFTGVRWEGTPTVHNSNGIFMDSLVQSPIYSPLSSTIYLYTLYSMLLILLPISYRQCNATRMPSSLSLVTSPTNCHALSYHRRHPIQSRQSKMRNP